MTINFYLNGRKEPKIIFCYIRDNYKTFQLHTDERIDSKFWDIKKQIVKRSHPNHNEINHYLYNFKLQILNYIRILKSESLSIPFEEIKDKVTKFRKKEEVNYFDIWEQYLRFKESMISAASLSKLKQVRKHLQEFQDFQDYHLNFNNINLTFFDLLLEYFGEKQFSANTIAKFIEFLKTFMNWAKERGYHNSTDYEQFKVKKYSNDPVTLTQEELNRIINLDLTNNIKLEKVKDLFVIGCLTAQRWSDFSDISKESVIKLSNGYEWRFITQKTKETNVIPLMPKVIEILEKYNYNLPKISNQKFNEYIKEIAELAMIDTPIISFKIVGGKKIEETNPKYKLIGSHTARRTFITISLINGMPSEVVKKISGHKSDTEFKKYIEIASNIKRTEMEKIWK